MKIRAVVVGALLAFTVSGCATIVGEPNQNISLSSTPSDAAVTIVDESGRSVFSGRTPTQVTLKKSDGSYWGGKNYVVTISKEGYEARTIPIKASPNGWYIAGNFLFGGLIGWFVVDPLNGDMYTLSPGEVNADLGGVSARDDLQSDSIAVVLLEDVPKSLRHNLTKIN